MLLHPSIFLDGDLCYYVQRWKSLNLILTLDLPRSMYKIKNVPLDAVVVSTSVFQFFERLSTVLFYTDRINMFGFI